MAVVWWAEMTHKGRQSDCTALQQFPWARACCSINFSKITDFVSKPTATIFIMTSETPAKALAAQIAKRIVESDKGPIEALTDQIEEDTRQNWKNEDFLPENKLEHLTERSIVKAALEAAKIAASDVEELVDFVCGEDIERSGRSLFLILIMMSEEREQLSLLKRLKDDGVNDGVLPIGYYSGGSFDRQGYWLEDPNGGKPGLEAKRFPVFAAMTRSNRTLFNSEQWRFLAPVFRSDRFRFRFNMNRRLPYLSASPEPVSNGYFGEVSQAEVLAAHAPESIRVSASLSMT